MNRRAKVLKLTETSFLDPNGLARNQASAKDLAHLAWIAMQDKLFREYVALRRHSYKVSGKDGQTRKVDWANTNKLLGEDGYDGIKTGTTNAAGDLPCRQRHEGRRPPDRCRAGGEPERRSLRRRPRLSSNGDGSNGPREKLNRDKRVGLETYGSLCVE